MCDLLMHAASARWGPTAPGGVSLGVLAALITIAAAFGASSAVAADQAVTVVDSDYVARRVAVLPGETVSWTYSYGADYHNVHFEDDLYRFPDVPATPVWMGARTFPAAGLYRYHCDEHGGPGGTGMSGIVYVNATGTLPPNLAPTASFFASPANVATGSPVAFSASASSDPDGSVVRYEWDLDGDGSFETDTGSQPMTTRSYPTAGTKTIGLRVTDDQNLTGVTTRSVGVTDPLPQIQPPAPPPPPATPATGSEPPSPEPAPPLSRLASSIAYTATARRRYTVLTALSVRGAIAGSTVRLACTGLGCPFKTRSHRVVKNAARFELLSLVRGKRLRAGTTLEIRVTKPGAVGVVRRLTIRAGRTPRSHNLCIAPGATKPGACPA